MHLAWLAPTQVTPCGGGPTAPAALAATIIFPELELPKVSFVATTLALGRTGPPRATAHLRARPTLRLLPSDLGTARPRSRPPRPGRVCLGTPSGPARERSATGGLPLRRLRMCCPALAALKPLLLSRRTLSAAPGATPTGLRISSPPPPASWGEAGIADSAPTGFPMLERCDAGALRTRPARLSPASSSAAATRVCSWAASCRTTQDPHIYAPSWGFSRHAPSATALT